MAVGIVGLTDRGPVFQEIGRLRLGSPKSDGRPRDLDHFRFDAPDPDVMAAFRDAYGDQPRRVRIYLPFPTTDQNFDAFMEHRVGETKVMHRCDGVSLVAHWDDRKKKLLRAGFDPDFRSGPCPFVGRDDLPPAERCRPKGYLRFIVPELRRLAYVTLVTGSVWNIKNLHGMLVAIEETMQRRGDRRGLQGIPFVLYRRKTRITRPDPKSPTGRTPLEKWLVYVEPDPTWQALQLSTLDQAALPNAESATERPALAAPKVVAAEDDDPDDGDDEVMAAPVNGAPQPSQRSASGSNDREHAWAEKLAKGIGEAIWCNDNLGCEIPIVDVPDSGAAGREYAALINQQFQRTVYALEEKATELGLDVGEAPQPTAPLREQAAWRDKLLHAVAGKLDVAVEGS